MRPLHLVLRGLTCSVALSITACSAPPPVEKLTPVATTRTVPAVSTRAQPEGATIETAPPAAVAEQVEPSPSQLVKDARAALAEGDPERALSLARTAVFEAPGRSAAWNTLGRAQLRLGQRRAALDSFEQAVECNPSSAWAQNNYGLALVYDGRYEEAIAALEEATDLQPEVGLMWNNLGMAYEHVDRIEEARFAYRHAMSLDHAGAAQNFVRIEGVRSLKRTARADIPEDMPLVVDEH